MEISFLDALRRGDLQQVSEFISKNRKILFDRDPEGRNCLGVAVAQGKWTLALTLLREYRVSPHAIDNNGEGLFHLIARGLTQNPARIEDYAEIRNELLTFWDKEERIEEAKIQATAILHPESRPPRKILVKKPAVLEKEFFGNLDLFFPKYLLEKYHVVLNKKEFSGKNPAEYAHTLGLTKLEEFYEEKLEYNQTRRRLLQGLNENLIREIGTYL